MQTEIRNLRVKIDGISQLVKELKPIKEYSELKFIGDTNKIVNNLNSNEINKTYDSLILAKAWLGKILGELGNESPYKNDGNRKDIKDIEPTADTEKSTDPMGLLHNNHLGFVATWSTKNHIEKVDWLREEIKTITDKVNRLDGVEHLLSTKNSYTHLYEARFWLGFELQRIKENK